jgi:hypothetical protein
VNREAAPIVAAVAQSRLCSDTDNCGFTQAGFMTGWVVVTVGGLTNTGLPAVCTAAGSESASACATVQGGAKTWTQVISTHLD